MNAFELSELLTKERPVEGGVIYANLVLYYKTGYDFLIPYVTETYTIVNKNKRPQKRSLIKNVFKAFFD